MSQPSVPPVPHPRVFISYSWTSEEHSDWVLGLATRLVGDRVDVALDRWDLKPGHDKFAFMERMVTDPTIDKVLLISDARYAGKADGREGGVGTETLIVTPEVYQQAKQEKFVPILRERDSSGNACLPVYLAGRIYIDLCEGDLYEENYDKLIRLIWNEPELKKPPLGPRPAHIFQPPKPSATTAGRFSRLKDAVEKGKPNVEALLRDYLDELAEALGGFRLDSGLSAEGYDEHVVGAIKGMRPYRDEFVEFCVLYAGHRDTEDAYASVHGFLERLLALCNPPDATTGYYQVAFDAHKFCNYEFALYLVAALLNYRRYKTVVRLLDETYVYRNPSRMTYDKSGFGGFNEYVRSLDEIRKSRLKLPLRCVSASLIRESATHRRIRFEHLVQADMLLMFRGPMTAKEEGRFVTWYPRLHPYSESAGTIEVFARADSPSGAAAIRDLFGAATPGELARQLSAAFQDRMVAQFVSRASFESNVDVSQLVNWQELRSRYLK